MIKKQQYVQLSKNCESKVYQFSQIIVKVYVEDCLEPLTKIMSETKRELYKLKEMKSRYGQVQSVGQRIVEFIEKLMPKIQAAYDTAIDQVKSNWMKLSQLFT